MTAPPGSAGRVEVDTLRCASTGMCESVAPELFAIDDDGALVLLQPALPADQVGAAQAAARACPTRALRVV